MKIVSFTFAASALALGLASLVTPNVQGQPLFDRVDVNLPYSVTIGDRTLQPGSYIIQQMRSFSGDSRVLLIYGDNGMKFETSAMTLPALGNDTQRTTRVVLHHIGPDYYFDKVWIQGKDYGYEFPLPNSVKQREREAMQPVSVAANYSSVPETTAAQTTTTQAATTQQSTEPPVTTQQKTAQQQTTTQQATTQQATTQQSTAQQATTQQATTPAETTQSTMQPATTRGTANREMPHTSAGWLMMLLTGGGLSGLGLKLRRKQ